MENCIPKFWERERESKKAFPTFGNGNGNEKLIPKLWEREWEAGIPGNGREREFPLTPDLSSSRMFHTMSYTEVESTMERIPKNANMYYLN